MVHARADLQQHAHQRHFIAHGFEEQLLEQVTGLEPVFIAEVPQRVRKPRIVFKRRNIHTEEPRNRGTTRLHNVLRALLIILLLTANLALWGTPVLLGGLVKLLTFGRLRRWVNRRLPWLGERWVQGNNLILDSLLGTTW